MIQITDSNFNSTIEANKFLVIRFTAPWCGPCRALKPIFAELEEKWKDQVTFAEVNVDECPVLTEKFSITSVPKTFFYDCAAGDTLGQVIGGAKPKADYDQAIANLVG